MGTDVERSSCSVVLLQRQLQLIVCPHLRFSALHRQHLSQIDNPDKGSPFENIRASTLSTCSWTSPRAPGAPFTCRDVLQVDPPKP
jgi:hypothetical protein